MIFSQRSIEGILNGAKTETRRLVKPGEELFGEYDDIDPVSVVSGLPSKPRLKWEVGKTYAVQPGRGKPAVARIRLLELNVEDVRHISLEDAIAEGFESQLSFWWVWCGMHDPAAQHRAYTQMLNRPNNRYQAWVLRFELAQVFVGTPFLASASKEPL